MTEKKKKICNDTKVNNISLDYYNNLLITITIDRQKVFEFMFPKFGYFLKHKALPQKAVLLKQHCLIIINMLHTKN